jgi:type IV pilus assembly protein PilQ
MITLKHLYRNSTPMAHKILHRICLVCITMVCGVAYAQENAIESITSNQQGANVIVKVTLKNPVTKPPIGFSITNPARIALDFTGTSNATGKSAQDIALGDVRNVNVVQAGERSRLVFNLSRPLNYATVIEGNSVVITIDGSGGVATAVNSSGLPVAQPQLAAAGPQNIRDVDFRRGMAGEGRIVVDLPNNQIAVDVKQQGQAIIVDFMKAGLPEVLRRRLDVTDFGTPVQTVTTTRQGENVHMVIEPRGLWEHSAYQSDTQLVIEVKPIKEEPNKLTQGTQGYKGEKLSLNFQSVEVRAVLQVIADFTGLNIITSDTVSGNLTLRLKDVPWDQALDIVMQAKGLDMRKNGAVLWIAPKDELLTKEKLELEQKSQIAELEPLRTESFQLNYQKAESFKTLLDNTASGGKSILSKRGSAVIETRSNQLFVTDIASKLDEIRKLIQKTDIASRQVLIEARVVEATDSFSKDLGAKLGFGVQKGTSNIAEVGGRQTGDIGPGATQFGTFGLNSTALQGVNGNAVSLPAAPASGALAGTVALTLFNSAATRFISMELSALESAGKGKILSSPRVVTANQLKAVIEQGTEVPYITASSSGATTITFRKAVLKLEVTPQITPDGNIILDVEINKDSLGDKLQIGSNVLYAINTKHINTQVLIENGGTVVIGGIYVQNDATITTKVPFFGDIPIIGNLFRSNAENKLKQELLIFLSPRIINDKIVIR